MLDNVYSPYSLAYTLCHIADMIGWEAFTETFTYFYNLPAESVPTSKLAKFNLSLTKLEDFSGKPVFKLITEREKAIYEAHLGGSVSGSGCTAQGFEFYDTSSSFNAFRILAKMLRTVTEVCQASFSFGFGRIQAVRARR
ncbi:MAG: hypothetical protein LBU94_01240 [Clostridiales bacterium]|jgi:hypothetical protein|nr:hypothetical protein [Clostridiales bacterium]